jgi:chromate transporter
VPLTWCRRSPLCRTLAPVEDRAEGSSSSPSDPPAADRHGVADGRLGELARLFLRLGVTAVGGPAAHVAMLHDEVVRRRGWLTDQRFLDLVAATNLVPGPSSTELAIHIGWDRARWRGLLVAGTAFIVPAALIVGGLAWLYVRYDGTPALDGVLSGIRPVVLAIVGHALVRLLPTAARTPPLAAVVVGAAAASLRGVHELGILVAGAVAVAGVRAVERADRDRLPALAPLAVTAADPEVWRVFTTFLRIGAVLYGSGYVLLAFLQGEVVERQGWITAQQLVDAVSIGQVTPGPVFTTATFVGHLTAGPWGAVAATVGIFLPAFAFVALLARLVDRIRASAILGAALDGVSAAAIGLMAAVCVHLADEALVDPGGVAIATAAALVLWRTTWNSAWCIAGGAAIGLVRAATGW